LRAADIMVNVPRHAVEYDSMNGVACEEKE